MKIVAKVIVEKVERPNPAKDFYKILVKEPGYVDQFDASKNRKDKFFPICWFHANCDLVKGERIETVIYVNSSEKVTDLGIEYYPYLSLHEYKKF